MGATAAIPQMIANSASTYGVPAQISLEVAMRESSLNQNARGAAGEIGVYQLMPSTAAGLGVNPSDLTQNIQGGNQYLAQLYARFGDWGAALAAYNWGPGNVANAIAVYGANWFSAIPSSTQDYVQSILGNAGTQYTPAITPDSLVNGAGDTVQAVQDATASWDPTTIITLTLAAVLGYMALTSILSD